MIAFISDGIYLAIQLVLSDLQVGGMISNNNIGIIIIMIIIGTYMKASKN